MKVLHYYTTSINSGGPMTYINTIIHSSLNQTYDFGVCFQEKTVKKLRISDIRRIVREIRAFHPDILHVHGLQSEGIIGLILGRIAKVPCILMTVHGMNHEATEVSSVKQWIFRTIIEPFTLKKSDYVYCVSKNAEKKDIIVKNAKRLLPCIQNAVIYKQGDPVERKTLGIPEDAIVVVVVGRVSKDKGMLTLEQIIDNSAERYYFVIVGEGDYSPVMKTSYNGNQRVIFTGFTENPYGYMNISDIYLCVSLHENMSIALLEACQHCLPAIVTDVGDNADVIRDGINGYVFNVGDAKAALRCLNTLSSDKKMMTRMGQEARKIVNSEYSINEMLSKIDKIYQEVNKSATHSIKRNYSSI
ncbi:MAG: glycosyltransferase [Parabacteroides sp.]|nr:glycosyltransferase [Parabacteroides sp.]